jgi:paired amphipathic helix protein Sin3a
MSLIVQFVPRIDYLSRNERAVRRRPLESACLSRSGLEIKVCVRTYRMFFVSRTEDFLWRDWTSEDREGVSKRSLARTVRSRRWMERLDRKALSLNR